MTNPLSVVSIVITVFPVNMFLYFFYILLAWLVSMQKKKVFLVIDPLGVVMIVITVLLVIDCNYSFPID